MEIAYNNLLFITKSILNKILELIKDLEVKSFLYVPCGD